MYSAFAGCALDAYSERGAKRLMTPKLPVVTPLMIEDATNSLELATGLDLDGDGDIGLKGHKGTTQRRRERHTADGVAGLRPDGNTVARRRERNKVD